MDTITLWVGVVLLICSIANIVLLTLREYTIHQKKTKTPKNVPVDSLLDIDSMSFEERIAKFKIQYDKDPDWWIPPYPMNRFKVYTMHWQQNTLETQLRDDQCCRIFRCYDTLNRMSTLKICPFGCDYLILEYYYAILAIEELAEQKARLTELKSIANGKVLPNNRIDASLAEIDRETETVIERFYEDELLELVRYALVEELKTIESQDRILLNQPSHSTTIEEIERLKVLVNEILSGSSEKQLVAVADTCPDGVT